MTHLVPCVSCQRHVRANAETCPFCGVEVDASRPVPGQPTRRLGRAAIFAFGAALSTAAGCAERHTPDDGGRDAGVDAGNVFPPYGLPPDDGGEPAPLYGGAPED